MADDDSQNNPQISEKDLKQFLEGKKPTGQKEGIVEQKVVQVDNGQKESLIEKEKEERQEKELAEEKKTEPAEEPKEITPLATVQPGAELSPPPPRPIKAEDDFSIPIDNGKHNKQITQPLVENRKPYTPSSLTPTTQALPTAPSGQAITQPQPEPQPKTQLPTTETNPQPTPEPTPTSIPSSVQPEAVPSPAPETPSPQPAQPETPPLTQTPEQNDINQIVSSENPQPQSTEKTKTAINLPIPQEETIPENATQNEMQQPTPQPSKFKNFCGIVLIFLSIIVLAGAIWWFMMATGTVIFSVQPAGAEIKIGDKTAQTNDIVKLKPGRYIVSIKKNGFIEYKKEVTIERLKKINIEVNLKQIPAPTKILTDKIQDYYLIGDEIYVLSENGKTIYKLEEEEETEEVGELLTKKALTPSTLNQITEIIWHPEDKIAIFKIKQNKTLLKNTPFKKSNVANGKIMTWLYNFNRDDLINQKATYWGTDIGDMVWSPDGEKIYYVFTPTTGEKSIISASKNNQNLERLLNIKEEGIASPKLSISPDGKFLSLIPVSEQYKTSYIYTLEVLTQELKKIVSEGNNIETLFSPDSQKLTYSIYQENTEESEEFSHISTADIKGENKKDLKIVAFINRVIWKSDSKSLIVAESAGENKTDHFYEIDITSGEKTEYIYSSELVIKPKKVLYSSGRETAYFIVDGYLYSLELASNKY